MAYEQSANKKDNTLIEFIAGLKKRLAMLVGEPNTKSRLSKKVAPYTYSVEQHLRHIDREIQWFRTEIKECVVDSDKYKNYIKCLRALENERVGVLNRMAGKDAEAYQV